MRYQELLPRPAREWLRGQKRRLLLRHPELFVVGSRRQALARMERIIRERPIAAQVELTTLCNSRCVFCAYRKLRRAKSVLSPELFERLARELAGLGGIHLGLSGIASDPLIDPLLLSRMRLLRERYPSIHPHLFTNAIALSRFSDEEVVLLLRSLVHVDISIGGLCRADYATMFGVDKFEEVWRSLLRLARLRDRSRAQCRLYLHVRTHRLSAARGDPRLAQLRAMGYECSDIMDSFSDWGGLVSGADVPRGATVTTCDNSGVRAPCLFPMTSLSVLADGRVTACGCMDATEQLVVGDLREDGVRAIWGAERLARVRESFRQAEPLPLCQQCSYYRPYQQVLSARRFLRFEPWQDVWR